MRTDPSRAAEHGISPSYARYLRCGFSSKSNFDKVAVLPGRLAEIPSHGRVELLCRVEAKIRSEGGIVPRPTPHLTNLLQGNECWLYTAGASNYSKTSNEVGDNKEKGKVQGKFVLCNVQVSARKGVFALAHGVYPKDPIKVESACGTSTCVNPHHVVSRPRSPKDTALCKVQNIYDKLSRPPIWIVSEKYGHLWPDVERLLKKNPKMTTKEIQAQLPEVNGEPIRFGTLAQYLTEYRKSQKNPPIEVAKMELAGVLATQKRDERGYWSWRD